MQQAMELAEGLIPSRSPFEAAGSKNRSPETVIVGRRGPSLAAPDAVNAARGTPIEVRQVRYLGGSIVLAAHQRHFGSHRTDAPDCERPDEMFG
ncbi:hypothetical protein [Paraburkholderia sp.]|uniref:hypothetical protein n=1 Tax=Paraburkholderia sp. TaxID=1926495 RepID=UPI002D74786A|nr:hypothetical protein [Paraburkholderia sp.]HZZ04411.1 hypothetical protein [Paraburkholderia sp.]